MSATLERTALRVFEEYLPPPPELDVALAARGISVAFGGLQALDDVSITVPSGRLVGLMGPNGAGKSVFMDTLNGLRTPDQGTVELFGRDITTARAWDRAKLGMARTFQSNRVSLELTVAQNLRAGAYHMIPGGVIASILGLPHIRAGERRVATVVAAVAELLDLTSAGDEPVGSLDFGMQRRVEIGRSLLCSPRLLLMDEPAAGLDATEAAALFALIRGLAADLGLTVLLVEHYVKAVLENCDLVYVLNEGRLIASGPPQEIAVNPDVRAAYLGTDDEDDEDDHGTP